MKGTNEPITTDVLGYRKVFSAAFTVSVPLDSYIAEISFIPKTAQAFIDFQTEAAQVVDQLHEELRNKFIPAIEAKR